MTQRRIVNIINTLVFAYIFTPNNWNLICINRLRCTSTICSIGDPIYRKPNEITRTP